MTRPIEKWANFQWPAAEQWRPTEGIPGYEVSDRGRLRSLLRGNPRLVKGWIDRDGYLRVSLWVRRSYVNRLVHRLVATAFNGPSPEGLPVCCHNDGNKSNNRPENLRWATQAQNIADKALHGTEQIGSRHPRAIVDEQRIARVKQLLRSGARSTTISRETGVSLHVVRDVRRNRTWRHVQ